MKKDPIKIDEMDIVPIKDDDLKDLVAGIGDQGTCIYTGVGYGSCCDQPN